MYFHELSLLWKRQQTSHLVSFRSRKYLKRGAFRWILLANLVNTFLFKIASSLHLLCVYHLTLPCLYFPNCAYTVLLFANRLNLACFLLINLPLVLNLSACDYLINHFNTIASCSRLIILLGISGYRWAGNQFVGLHPGLRTAFVLDQPVWITPAERFMKSNIEPHMMDKMLLKINK